MKRFLKHALCAVLILAVSSSMLLTGCGKKDSTTASDAGSAAASASTSPQAEESSRGNTSKASQTDESRKETDASAAASKASSTEDTSEKATESTKTTESTKAAETAKAPDTTKAAETAKTPDTTKAAETATAPSESHRQENWSDYSDESQGWGQGVNFNSKNQPEGSLSYQKKYDSYDAHFIGSDTDSKVIWLTLDEGYENGYTAEILDVLKEKNCQAVFFITGSYAKQNPDLIRRMIDEGHVVGNHSWSHPSKGMPSLSVEEQIEDITRLHDYVKEHYDYEMTLFRNPAGIFSERSLAVTRSLGYDSMFWSFAYADWDPDKQPDPEEALKKLTDRLHPGALYLLHAVSKTNTEILGDFIDQARSQGYEFKLP
ncbi:MAG: polysaccharide deacetylase family protein [Lachnospiraceae bacterium]|nr:polysaccharide deacetylase family protein [Lachnospiraceae bacterium]